MLSKAASKAEGRGASLSENGKKRLRSYYRDMLWERFIRHEHICYAPDETKEEADTQRTDALIVDINRDREIYTQHLRAVRLHHQLTVFALEAYHYYLSRIYDSQDKNHINERIAAAVGD
jgi:hypothetical protein